MKRKITNNLAGIESEVHVFFQSNINKELKTKAACILLTKLNQFYGYSDNANIKKCPHSDLQCDGHEYLLNGSRAYLDHGYLEYATPACMTTSETVSAISAGDRMIQKAAVVLQDELGKDAVINAIRNNIDHQGHSFGTHVNIRMTREGYERIFDDSSVLNGFVVPFFVSLPVICGSGRCSSESNEEIFQIWQRSDFIKEIIGLQTMCDRPLINTRNESLSANPLEYARFHIIAFDANRLEVSQYLKIGLLRLLYAAVDADQIDVALELADPIKAIGSVSRNPFKAIRLASNKSITALEMQHAYLVAFTKLFKRGTFHRRVPDAGEILNRWKQVLTSLEKKPFSLIGILDWVTKFCWLEQVRVRKDLKWTSPQMKWWDIQYHSLINPPEIPHEKITNGSHVNELMKKAPQNSRALIRSELLGRFGKEISELNWHYVIDLDKTVYLLPDNPQPDSIKSLNKAKTLKQAATLMGLDFFSLNYEDSPRTKEDISKEKKQIEVI